MCVCTYEQAPLVNYYYSLIVIKLEQLLSFVIILFISRIPLHYSFIYLFLMKIVEKNKYFFDFFFVTLLTNKTGHLPDIQIYIFFIIIIISIKWLLVYHVIIKQQQTKITETLEILENKKTIFN